MKRMIILVLVLVVAFGVFFLLRKDLNHTAEIATNDFSIPFNPKIDKIFYASNDKSKGFLTFTRDKNEIWVVDNGKNNFIADTNSLNDLLQYILPKIEVQSPVNDAALDNVNRNMALNGVKAQFFEGNNLVKTIYVGDRTADDLGTYMYLPGTKRPVVVKIPGHNGYLTPFFNTDINNWRTLALVDIPAVEIHDVEVKWNYESNESFKIINSPEEPSIFNRQGQKVTANKNRMLAYLDMFTAITREAGEPAGINKSAAKDSILRSTPFLTFRIKTKKNQTVVLNLYKMKVSSETYSPETKEGELKVYEIETFWGSIQGSNEIWVMQDAILKNRMKRLSDFAR